MFFVLLRIHWQFEEQAPLEELRQSLHRLGRWSTATWQRRA